MRNSIANADKKNRQPPFDSAQGMLRARSCTKDLLLYASLHSRTISQWNQYAGEGYNATVPEPRQVVVYSRKGCHLCEVVKESLSKLSRQGGFTWQEVDVDSNSELRRQFNDEVPVVFIDGHKAFKYRMDEREFMRKLVS